MNAKQLREALQLLVDAIDDAAEIDESEGEIFLMAERALETQLGWAKKVLLDNVDGIHPVARRANQCGMGPAQAEAVMDSLMRHDAALDHS